MSDQWTRNDVSPTMRLQISGCGGDVDITGHNDTLLLIEGDTMLEPWLQQDGDTFTISGYAEDLKIRVPHRASVDLRNIGGDVEVRAVADANVHAVARLEANGIGGDLHVAQVPQIEVGTVGGDVTIVGDSENVSIGQVGGDLEMGRATSLHVRAVGGDAQINEVAQLHTLGPIGGDLRLVWSGRAGETHNLQSSVGGDMTLYLGDANDLTIVAMVGGDVRGQGDGWNIKHGSGRHQLVFGSGSTRWTLMIGGDLHIKGRTAPQHAGNGQEWNEWRGSMDQFGDEMRGLGRDLEEMGRTLARDLGNLGREIAREVRIAGRDAARDAGKAYVYGRFRKERDRGFNFDPEQIERLKREARAAAASGIARAQEAVEEALGQIQQNLNPSNRPTPPRPPVPPTPPTSGYTGQTRRMNPQDAVGASAAQQAATSQSDRDAERLAILRMVYEGRISPDEAEVLLRGLEDAA